MTLLDEIKRLRELSEETAPVGPGRCNLCGEMMPRGQEMFKYHGFSGNCPKPPLEKKERLSELEARTAIPKLCDELEKAVDTLKGYAHARKFELGSGGKEPRVDGVPFTKKAAALLKEWNIE